MIDFTDILKSTKKFNFYFLKVSTVDLIFYKEFPSKFDRQSIFSLEKLSSEIKKNKNNIIIKSILLFITILSN